MIGSAMHTPLSPPHTDVLGQDEGKLKLIRGAAHTPLTATIARGHSLIYTCVHLTHPAAPGFSTLIFGLNLRSSGFCACARACCASNPHAQTTRATRVRFDWAHTCLLYTSPSPRDQRGSRMPSSA